MGPTWVLPAPYGPHIGPMNLAIRVSTAEPLLSLWDILHIPERRGTSWSFTASPYVPTPYYSVTRTLVIMLEHLRKCAGCYGGSIIWMIPFSYQFSWMEIDVLLFKFHWNVFSIGPIGNTSTLFKQWLCAEQATGHYQNQWWLSLLTQCVTMHCMWPILGRWNMTSVLVTKG